MSFKYRSMTDLRCNLLASACVISALAGLSTQSASADDAKILRFAEITEPTVLSLHQDLGNVASHSLQAIYESLLTADNNMQLQPGLAESWEQLDETTYRIVLREGVSFHSGNPLTAESVKDYIDWQLGPEGMGTYFRPVSEITVVDDLTLDFHLSHPYGPFLLQLTMPHTAIGDQRLFEEIGREEMNVQPSGTGPFMLESWDLGSQVILEPNPDYWDGAPALDGVQFSFIPDGAARSIAIESGDVDVAVSVPPPDLERLEANDDVNISDAYELRSITWPLNVRHPILSDVNVRKALAHAIDYSLVIESLLGEGGRVQTGFVPEGTYGYAENSYEHDPELAAELLAESGWEKNAQGIYEKDGEPLALSHFAGGHVPMELEIAEGFQALLAEFGIDLTVEVMERATHVSHLYEAAGRFAEGGERPDYASTQWDHGIRTGDSSVMLDPLFTCEGTRNFSHYCSEEFEDLITVAVSGAPEEERLAAYSDAMGLLYEDVVALPMWTPRLTMASRNTVDNLDLHPTGVITSWSDMALD